MKNRERGVTLTELVVTISIAGILAAVALPSFQQLIQSNRLTTETNQLIGMIHLARSEAVKTGGRTSVCAGENGICGDDWKKGILVFVDANGDCEVDKDDSDNPLIIKVGNQSSDESVQIIGTSVCLTFSGLGMKVGPPDTVSICGTKLSSGNRRVITIDASGSPRVKVDTQAGCL